MRAVRSRPAICRRVDNDRLAAYDRRNEPSATPRADQIDGALPRGRGASAADEPGGTPRSRQRVPAFNRAPAVAPTTAVAALPDDRQRRRHHGRVSRRSSPAVGPPIAAFVELNRSNDAHLEATRWRIVDAADSAKVPTSYSRAAPFDGRGSGSGAGETGGADDTDVIRRIPSEQPAATRLAGCNTCKVQAAGELFGTGIRGWLRRPSATQTASYRRGYHRAAVRLAAASGDALVPGLGASEEAQAASAAHTRAPQLKVPLANWRGCVGTDTLTHGRKPGRILTNRYIRLALRAIWRVRAGSLPHPPEILEHLARREAAAVAASTTTGSLRAHAAASPQLWSLLVVSRRRTSCSPAGVRSALRSFVSVYSRYGLGRGLS